MPCEDCPENQTPAPALPPLEPSDLHRQKKPCDGCPEHGSRQVAIIVYTGGPNYASFANVLRALTPDSQDIITKWSRPTVHPHGEIEYQQNEAEPPEIEGYKRDASNPRLLRPVWPHCVWRTLRVWREDTGAVSISAGCLTPASGVRADKSLKLATCQNCSVRTS